MYTAKNRNVKSNTGIIDSRNLPQSFDKIKFDSVARFGKKTSTGLSGYGDQQLGNIPANNKSTTGFINVEK
jgi:hypothetical protein